MSKATDKITRPNGREVNVCDTDLYHLDKALDVILEDYLVARVKAHAERAKFHPQVKKLEAIEKAKTGHLMNPAIRKLWDRPAYRKAWDRWNGLAYALHALTKQIAGEKPEHPVHFAIQAKAAQIDAALYSEIVSPEMTAAVTNICKAAGVKPPPKAVRG
jgi:hypothetical protein